MRILMISDVYFPRVNGVSSSIRIFRRELAALGHQVTLIAPDYPDAQAEPGVIRISSRYLSIDPEDRLMRRGPIMARLDELRAANFDLVHIQTPFVAHWVGVALARRLGIPCVESYHTYFEEYVHCYLPRIPRSWSRLAARALTRRQCNQIDAVIAPSTAMRDVLREYGVTAPIEVLPTGIDAAELEAGDRVRFRRRYGIAPERPVLLYVGRVAKEKNIEFLLEMAARLRTLVPDVLLVIAGEGPASESLKALGSRLRLDHNLLFIGYLDRREALPGCYLAADLFVFASRTETQGLVLLEAMAAGLPVVSTAMMGTRDVLRDGEGAVVVKEELSAFVPAVVRLLDDPAERQRLSARARAYAAHWSSAATAVRLIDLYRSTGADGVPQLSSPN